MATPDGQNRALSRGEAISLAAETPVVLMNAPLTGQRLGYPELNGLDLLELWALIFPARFVVPTASGFAHALGLEPPSGNRMSPPSICRSPPR